MLDTPLMLVELSVMEQRYQAVSAVVHDGVSVVEVARRLEVSRQSVRAWLARYEKGGLAALADRSHRPKGCAHQMTASVEALVLELRRRNPGHAVPRGGAWGMPSREWISVRVRGWASGAPLDLFTIGATTRHRAVFATPRGVARASVALPRSRSGRPVLVQVNCRTPHGPVLSVTWALA